MRRTRAGGIVVLAVLEGNFQGGFLESAERTAGVRCAGTVGEHDHLFEGELERRPSTQVAARFIESVVGVSVGGWHSLRGAAGRCGAMHSGGGRRDGEEEEGTAGAGRRLPGERGFLTGGAFGSQGAGTDGLSPTRRR